MFRDDSLRQAHLTLVEVAPKIENFNVCCQLVVDRFGAWPFFAEAGAFLGKTHGFVPFGKFDQGIVHNLKAKVARPINLHEDSRVQIQVSSRHTALSTLKRLLASVKISTPGVFGKRRL